MRTSPTASGGRVFAITVDNQMFALAADDGRRLWSYSGVIEDAGLLGGGAPAVVGDVVVAGFTSGEIVALKVETGRVLWGDNLAGVARGDAIATLADIRGMPVVDRDQLFAVSNSGTMAAFDINRGGRVWTVSIGSNQTPWVAGDFIYMLTTDSEVVCLTRDDGRVRWIQGLPRFRNEEDHEGVIAMVRPGAGRRPADRHRLQRRGAVAVALHRRVARAAWCCARRPSCRRWSPTTRSTSCPTMPC